MSMEQNPYFNKDLVLLGVQTGDKWALIERMVDTLLEQGAVRDQPEMTRQLILDAVLAREHERPTGLGNGFAFPHARIAGLHAMGLCLAIPNPPVDFGAPDQKPADVVCLMVVPEAQAQLALRVMAQFARLMEDEVDRQVLTKMDDPAVLGAYIARRVLGIDAPVTARDIMREPCTLILPDTPLREVTRLMHQHMLDAVAVTETDGTVVGEVTCDDLFKLGMPHFFGQLKSISFIREFDPFERYFAGEGGRLARDVMSQHYVCIEEDATLLEIVFELAVHRHAKVYVVREGKQVGVIDSILVLDRVINI